MEKNENFKTELENQYSILIRANEKKEHQRYMVLLVIILITFSVCLVSMLFSFKAFYTTKEINVDNQVISNTHNHTLTTMFNNGRTFNISKITNGYELSTPKIIQITNEGNSDIIFDIKLSSIKTTLLSTNNLVYTLTRDNSTSDAMSLPLSDKVIVQNLTIEPGETITFTLKVKFTGFLENNNTDNSYSANIIVEQKNNKADLLE